VQHPLLNFHHSRRRQYQYVDVYRLQILGGLYVDPELLEHGDCANISTAVGGAPLTLGGGTIADLINREQRGTAMALWMMGPSAYLPLFTLN
jgi:hypothetical protein